jgi:flagellar basal-body rod protein FlgF
MDRLAFNASAAITEMRLARQALANEMANMTTTGFKRSYDVSLKAFRAEGEGFDSNYQPQAVHMDFIKLAPGPLMATGRDLDILMNDQTVLGVQAPNGELAFTRRGDLQVNVNGVLQTGNGHPVLGDDQSPIAVPPGFKVMITQEGGIFIHDPNLPGVQPQTQIAQLLLRDASKTPLTRREDGLFKAHDKPTGADFASGPIRASVTTQALEGSNVSPTEAMVKLIEQSRMFEQQVRMVKASQENDQSGSSMLKLAN